jgi:gas vesicle protein
MNTQASMEDVEMADQKLSETSLHTSQTSSRPSAKSGDQIASAGKDIKGKAAEFTGSSAEAIKERASEAADAAREVGSQAAGRLKEEVGDKKDAGARYVSGIAEAMRRAAHEFDEDFPIAGKFLRNGAEQVDNASEALRKGDFGDLLHGARDFARRQPTAFLGLAVLAGFGAVRFMKSSADHDSNSDQARRMPANSQGG